MADATKQNDQDNPRKRILLVEDDHALASVYQSRLESEGYDVVHADNGEDALAELHASQYSLVVLDIMMPKIGGLDVLDLLRSNESTRNLKVLMLTALGQEKDKQRAQDLGADAYLVKSRVMLDEVVSNVNTLANS